MRRLPWAAVHHHPRRAKSAKSACRPTSEYFSIRRSALIIEGAGVAETTQYRATGRRKTSVARVFLRPGSGKLVVNRRAFESYFPSEALRAEVRQPLLATDTAAKFDVLILACGGGVQGQAGAARLGIARALLEYDPELRVRLRKEGYLTRDSRGKERKKYGQKGARKRFQFSKR